MPWVWKTVTKVNPYTGFTTTTRVKVWVAPAKPKKKVKVAKRSERDTEKAHQNQQALRAVQRAAARRAALEKKRAAQRAMWRQLQGRAKEVRDTIARPTQTTGRPNNIKPQDEKILQRKALADAAATAARKKRDEALANKWAAAAAFYKKQQEAALRERRLAKAEKEAGKQGTGVRLESLIYDAEKRQRESGGHDLNNEYLDRLDKAYEAHVTAVAQKFAAQVEKLQAAYVMKNGLPVAYKSESAANTASRILSSQDFKDLQREYIRLQGQSGDGEFVKAMTARQQIADSQRKYVYDIAKETLFRKAQMYMRSGDKAAASNLLSEWDKGGKYLFEAAASEIDPTKTSIKGWTTDKYGRRAPVYRTVMEEFEYRKSQYVTEMKRQYQNWQRQQESIKIGARQIMREQSGTNMAQTAANNEIASQAMKNVGIDNATTPDDAVKVVEESLRIWDEQNRDKILKPRTKELLAMGGRSALIAQQTADYKAYRRELARKRQTFFEVFHAQDPSWWDKVVQSPVVQEAFNALGVGVGGIGSGARVIAKVTTGSSVISVGINLDTVPKRIKDAYGEWQNATATGTTAMNPRAPLGIFGAGNAVPSLLQEESPLDTWLKTTEGKAWFKKYKEDEAAKAGAEDYRFGEAMTGDLWTKLKGISQYGMSPFNSDIINLAFNIAADPTNAIPLKATTWLGRLNFAVNETQAVTGLKGLKRLTLAANKWMTVTEPELRFQRTLAPYLKKLDSGADPAAIREEILQRLGGIKDATKRDIELRRQLQRLGIDPRSASGHQLASQVEEALAAKFKAAGVDLRSVADEAQALETKRIADLKAEEFKRAADIRAADAAREAAELQSKSIVEGSHAKLAAAKKAEEAALRARVARPVVAAAPPASPVRAPAPTSGPTDPVHIALRAQDPMRANASPETAQLITGHRGAQQVHGVEFFPGRETDTFLRSAEYADIQKQLGAVKKDGKPNTAARKQAELRLYEYGRRTFANHIKRQEAIDAPLKDGMIPWEPTAIDPTTVRGARKSGEQYIATASDLASRSGAHSPAEEILVAKERSLYEEVKKRLFSLRAQLDKAEAAGKSESVRADIVAKVEEEILGLNLYRRETSLSDDMQSGVGDSIRGEVDHQMATIRIATGRRMLKDFVTQGHLRQYYETFSMIPGMRSGPGYETALMKNILTPAWRATLTRSKFANMMRRNMFTDFPGPVEFRQAGTHLFALFHMTLLDGNLDLLEQYGKSINALLDADPMNIYGRMWKVMETRAGLRGSDDFLVSENAFVATILRNETAAAEIGGSIGLHPNLALAMIPYGPMARPLPIGHGYSQHLQGLATTLDPLFRASPPGWSDAGVIQALTDIAHGVGVLEEHLTRAGQIVHYIAARYGSVMRRARFGVVTKDFNIEASLASRSINPDGAFDTLEKRFMEQQYEILKPPLDNAGRPPQQWVEGISLQFNRILRGDPAPGRARLQFGPIRELYDEMYWRNQITHDNAGLHTATFLQKMQDARIQRGESWVRYADAYYSHMVAAGAGEEATRILKIIFEPEIKRAYGEMYEALTDLGKTVDIEHASQTHRGHVRKFMIRAKIITNDSMERAIADGRARKARDEGYAETEAREQAMRNEFVVADDATRTLDEAANIMKADTTHAYDMMDLTPTLEHAQRQIDILNKLDEQGAVLLAKGKRPSKVRIESGVKGYRRVLREAGDDAARQFAHKLPDDVRPWVVLEIRNQNAYREVTRLLNSVVHKTIDIESISTDVGRQMEELVALVKGMPGGQAFINQWGAEYSTDLFRSRLIDYLKHEEFFIDQEARGLTVDRLKQIDPELRESLQTAPTPETKPRAPDAEPPVPPDPVALNSARVSMAQRGLNILLKMTEEEWLARELNRARHARDVATTKAEKEAAFERIRDVGRARKVIAMSKSGGRGSYIAKDTRANFAARAVHFGSERARAMIRPNKIAPYVLSGVGAMVEQGRYLYRLLSTALVDEALGAARVPGEVSATYKTHGAAIEAIFDRPISKTYLRRFGFPDTLLDEVTATDILTGLEDFKTSLRDPRFGEFVNALTIRMEQVLQRTTKDKTYTIERWLDDRMVQRGDFYDALKYEKDDRIVQRVIVRARGGAHRTTKTDLRRRPGTHGENPLVEMIESDVRAVVAKNKVLSRMGVDPHTYNEARMVLRNAMIRKRSTLEIVQHAAETAAAKLAAAGMKVDDAGWDKAWRKEFDEAFLAKRQEMTDKEADELLGLLAQNEMFGSKYMDIVTEFEKRYGMDMEVKNFEPGPITPYQKRTLEEAVKTHLKIPDLSEANLIEGLSRHGQHPPFHNRSQMREWLSKYGFWSPRTGQMIEAGKKSWSIQDEAAYYKSNWGYAPDWANPDFLMEGGKYREILFDERMYGEMNRKWGLFNRNMEARFHSGQMTREERVRFIVEGHEALGLKAKRDWVSERRYVIERYGDLVTDGSGNLTAFPWLMNKEELGRFVTNRSKDAIADDLIQNADELAILHGLIDKYIGDYFSEYLMKGRTVDYEYFFRMTSNIVHDLLKDPIWLDRPIDNVGRVIKGQAALRRALVFTHLGFLTTNVIDAQIKGAWSSFTTRSFKIGAPSDKALSYGLLDYGLDTGSTLLKDVPVHGTERWREADSKWERLIALTELPAQGASAVEQSTKLRLAQEMYDGAYARALHKLGDEGLADAAAREFVKDEVIRLWPTVGDGPVERLFNSLSPFLSYQFKNRVLFISEIAAHPAIFNYFNRIGDFIEKENRREWAEKHPNEVLDKRLARLIELPWAPGVFIDLGQFSDAQRGLKPLYQAADGEVRPLEFASNFVRLVGPNDQNIAYGIMNSLHYMPHYEWVQGVTDGFPNGVWTKVAVPWEAPWGGTANALNSFWPVERMTDFYNAMQGGWSVQAATKAFYQTMFFGGLKFYDKGAGLNSFYFNLKATDPDAAARFLLTADGAALRMWWTDRMAESDEVYTPQEIKDMLDPPRVDPNPWFHSKSDEFQRKVRGSLTELREMRAKWDSYIWDLTPGTSEYKQAKLDAATERWQYYQDHPWMYEFEAFSKTPAEWARTLNDWEVDDLTQAFFDMEAPKASDFKTAVLWQAAMREWRKQREQFLIAFPQVAQRIGSARSSVEAVWKDTEQGWFDVLDRVGTRSIAIEAARQAEDFDLVDQLYVINELDFDILSKDTAVFYFDPTKDFAPLSAFDKERERPAKLLPGPFGQSLVSRVKILPDFNKFRFDRMTVEEKAVFERDQKYAQGIGDIIKRAKASGNFGLTFVRELRKNPFLLAEYFRRNPGKREQWAATDEYIRLISRFGIMMKEGKFDAGRKYFDNLPDWVKARYYEKHPERKQKIQQNLEYIGFMKRWVAHYKRRDYEGGAAFFESMPQWVKDRYYAKHPNGFGRGGGGGFGNSPYSKAMKRWVTLLQNGKKDEAKRYFDSLPQAFKDRYYSKHPDQKLRDDVKRTGQLGKYFALEEQYRADYLRQNPEFAKWLRAQGNSAQTRRMLIMEAYRALPKEDDWLRRVFRERYPEVFSVEAKGEQSLRKTYGFLAEHPDMLPGFEKWLAAVWASYEDMLKHPVTRPKEVVSDHSRTRRHGSDRQRPHSGKSAAWVRIHSLS